MKGPTGCCRRNFNPSILRSRTISQTTSSVGVDLRRNLLENSVFDFLIPPDYHLPRTLRPSPSIVQADGEGNGERHPLEGAWGWNYSITPRDIQTNSGNIKKARFHLWNRASSFSIRSNSHQKRWSNKQQERPLPQSALDLVSMPDSGGPLSIVMERGWSHSISHRHFKQIPARTKKPGSISGTGPRQFPSDLDQASRLFSSSIIFCAATGITVPGPKMAAAPFFRRKS